MNMKTQRSYMFLQCKTPKEMKNIWEIVVSSVGSQMSPPKKTVQVEVRMPFSPSVPTSDALHQLGLLICADVERTGWGEPDCGITSLYLDVPGS